MGLNVDNKSVSPFQSRCDCWVVVLIIVIEAEVMFGLVKVRVVFSTSVDAQQVNNIFFLQNFYLGNLHCFVRSSSCWSVLIVGG